MASTRASSRKLFPVFIDEPSCSAKPTPTTVKSRSTTGRGLSVRSSTNENASCTNIPLAPAAVPVTKKKAYSGLGSGEAVPKKRRVVLRDVSQEYEVEGEEPTGFRDIIPVKPSSKKLQIFVDDPTASSKPSAASVPPPSSTQPKKKSGLQIYTSPVKPSSTASAPAPKRRAPLGGLGGGAKGLRA